MQAGGGERALGTEKGMTAKKIRVPETE